MNVSIAGVNYIGYTAAKSGTHIFQTFSCEHQTSNDEQFAQIVASELEAILEIANQAESVYSVMSIENRKGFLKELMDLLEVHRDVLVSQFCKESSLSEKRANAELTRSKVQIQTYLDFISQPNWSRISDEYSNGVYYEKKMFPIGTVLVFGASNFPFAYSTIGGDVISALAAGNPVIYKANPFHAGVSEMCAQIILKAAKKNHLPDGVFSLVQGEDYWIGEKLVKDERVKAVGFTGSIKGGVALLNYAKERVTPIPVFCEMGSLNPTFIFNDALENKLEELVRKLSFAITNDAGQYCTKPGLIFVDKNKGVAFEKAMGNVFEKMEPIPMLHPSIYQSYQRLIGEFSSYKSYLNANAKAFYATPMFVVMTLEEFKNSLVAKEEVFGPFSILVTCESEEDMKQAMKQLTGQLTASFWTDKEISEEWMYLATNKVGRIVKNGVSTGVAVIGAMHHGGSFPATSDSRFTAVGKDAINRFLHAVTIQVVS